MGGWTWARRPSFVVGTAGRATTRFGALFPMGDPSRQKLRVLKLFLHRNSYEWRFVPLEGGSHRRKNARPVTLAVTIR